MRLTIILALCATLAACGGGGEDPEAFVGPPNCTQGVCR